MSTRTTILGLAGALSLITASIALPAFGGSAEARRGADDPAGHDAGEIRHSGRDDARPAVVAPAAASKSSGKVAATVTKIRLSASADFPGAEGKAAFKLKGTQRELEIEVEHVPTLAGQSVDFFLGTTKLGSGVVSVLGEAELNLENAAAPAAVAGMTVTVRTAGGVVIATGMFPA